ncbi:MAG: SirB1 family protein [Candidatus Polarisedimenticolia bacterium]
MMVTSARFQFLQMIARSDDQIDLVVAALLIAKEEYPDLDIQSCLGRLDRLAQGAAARLGALRDNPFAVLDAINTHLFGDEGFRGNLDDYFDARNSYLNDVLERRLGIPITLSLVYMEVAARLKFPLHGIGFPGHFLVKYEGEGRELLIDPFHQGAIVMPEDCHARLKEAFGDEVPLARGFFRPVGPRQILFRMLSNLKHVHLRREDFPRALSVLERLVALTPQDMRLRRDRGLLHLKLEQYSRAVEDLQAYITRRPQADDADEARRHIMDIRRHTALLN